LGSVLGATTIVGAAIVKEYEWLPVYGPPLSPLVESCAWTTKVKEPAAVGVPESTPLALNERPAGRLPLRIVKVYGLVPPLAEKITL